MRAFRHWIGERAAASGEDGALQILYRYDGGTEFDEVVLDHLGGYDGARPVRVGNDARTQLQLDIYGELMGAVYNSHARGGSIAHDGWDRLVRLMGYVCAHWREPDQGIWEMRGAPQHWLYSRVMCWTALDRALRLAYERGLPAPLERWRAERDAIYASVWDEFWDEARGHLVASADGQGLDAIMLAMPLTGFVSPTDPRWLATLDALARELADDPLVYRYRGEDGLDGREGAFTACSFLLVVCLAQAGRLAEARLLFEKMLGFASPLGLYAEEIGPSGEQLGNLPQALTHLTLIVAACELESALNEAEGAG